MINLYFYLYQIVFLLISNRIVSIFNVFIFKNLNTYFSYPDFTYIDLFYTDFTSKIY
jgi:hypothetical protein